MRPPATFAASERSVRVHARFATHGGFEDDHWSAPMSPRDTPMPEAFAVKYCACLQFYCIPLFFLRKHMDKIDRKLLNLLQRDASKTNVEMAGEVAMSPSSCLRRVRRLRRTGVIDRIVAILNPAKAGRVLKALVTVELKLHGEQYMRRFLDLACAEDAVS
jgi:hypothetical protein